MNKNMGPVDRKFRALLVAPVLVIAGLLVGPLGWLAIVLYALAVIMLATAAAEASLATWLHRILHNLAVDRFRRDREDATDDIAREVEAKWRQDSYTVDAAAVVERAETREELRDALVRLPVIYRTVVVLHDMEEMTVAEIADVQGIRLAAAKQRLRRGRMMLVSALTQGRERRAALVGVPLRCWDARRMVSDYLDGELKPDDRALVESHLETCPTCPPLLAGLLGTRAALGALRDPNTVVPVSLADRISKLLAG